MKSKLFFLIITIPFFWSACNRLDNKDKLLVSLYDKELYFSEIKNLIPEEKLDSTTYVEIYIDNWIKKQLLLFQAKMNLNDALNDVEKQIENYKSSLLIYAYQQEIIKQKFDTSITKEDIKEYYEKNQEDFELKENIFKGIFVKTIYEVPKLNLLNKLFRSSEDKDKERLYEYCMQFANDYHLSDSVWIYFTEIANKIPLEIKNERSYLKNNKYYTYTKDSSRYFLFIKEYKIKGSISPLSLVQDRIRKVILNRKKLLFLKDLENEIYQKAIANNKIKIYR